MTLVGAGPRILAREEPFAAQDVADGLRARGVGVREGVKATAAAREDGDVMLPLETGERLRGEELLVAVGRRPQTDDLGLETVGLQPGGYLETDDRLQVAGSTWLYALGDVNGRSLLTHMGKHQARVVADAIDGGSLRSTRDDEGAPLKRLWEAVAPFPTRSELWLKLLEHHEAGSPPHPPPAGRAEADGAAAWASR